MAKKESNLFNMVSTLLAISLIASAALGGVYELTKEPIAAARLAKKNAAISEVIPAFDNSPVNEIIKIPVDNDTLYFYRGTKDGITVGFACETFTKQGFNGLIKVMVGFLPDGSINDVTVLQHAETPGLGDKMDKKKSGFALQFKGKEMELYPDGLKVRKDGGDVDAITASTISSRAFCDAVNRASRAFAGNKELFGKPESATESVASASNITTN